MKALSVTPESNLVVRDVPTPTDQPPPQHVVIRMIAAAINPGDKFFLNARAQVALPRSTHDIWGASGAGTVIAAGAGVASSFLGRNVAVYRSLSPSEHTIGTWSELAQMPVHCCALIPEGLDAREYSGSLVNVITAYAFAKQAQAEGHRGVLITAGTSATGVALVGIARELGLPSIAIARDEAGRHKLRELGADEVVVQTDATFDADVQRTCDSRAATAVFDGVGGALLTRLIPNLARASTVYSYGYLGGHDVPLQIPTTMLMSKALTLRSFSNFGSPTVRDPQSLDAALRHIGELLALPQFKTRLGRTYRFEEIADAIAAVGTSDAKPVLVFD